MVSLDNTDVAFASKSDKELKKTYWLFKTMANERLVGMGTWFLPLALKMRIPISGIIKRTIFHHFCGGEFIADCDKRIKELSEYHIKTILDYSIEGKKNEADFDKCAAEIMATIKRAKDDADIPFSVFKVTGIANFDLLHKKNSDVKLSQAEEVCFQMIEQRLDGICKLAYESNVPVFIDAEESWIQNTIDALALEMIKRYNKEKAIVYNTCQLYRHDRLSYLQELMERARENGFKIGIKLVRGAYMEKERERAKSMNYPSPIQASKADTDRDFDKALLFCMEHIDIISTCCGSHNEKSTLYLVQLMQKKKITANDPRVYFAQLLGMSDHISYNLSKAGYNVAKYVPYGPVRDVIPYLMRRAEENTSIAGQTGRELNLIRKEMNRRKESASR